MNWPLIGCWNFKSLETDAVSDAQIFVGSIYAIMQVHAFPLKQTHIVPQSHADRTQMNEN